MTLLQQPRIHPPANDWCRCIGRWILAVGFTVSVGSAEPPASIQPFEIEVVDSQTRRGVPLIELELTSGVSYWTDSQGIIAFADPALMDQDVWFTVKGHGYEFPADGFGFRGRKLLAKPGGKARLEIERKNIAERLYRITGEGVYRDSVLTGRAVPIQRPLLNGQVTGSDTLMHAVFRDRVHWFWGDTTRPAYPLGNFQISGAISQLPDQGGLSPDQGIDLNYFVDERGFAKEMCRMAGDGPTWIDGLAVLKDASGHERMLAAYAKIRPPLDVYRRGICEWNVATSRFEHVADIPMNQSRYPYGHPFRVTEAGTEFLEFGDPFPTLRIRARVEDYLDPERYEAFSCYRAGAETSPFEIDRDEAGQVIWGWKKKTQPVDAMEESRLMGTGKLKPTDTHWLLRNRSSSHEKEARLIAHRGSVNWNPHLKKWIVIFTQWAGTSHLGEVWFAEADIPAGPWSSAVKIVTHEKYTFYNPVQHPEFTRDGRHLYFEGTYCNTFSGNPHRTPRYDYNQIMYRLDLDDSRLRDAKNRP